MVSHSLSALVSEAEYVRGDAEAALSIAEKLGSLLREEARGGGSEYFEAKGGVRFVEEASSIMVVGDIHGDIDTLIQIFSQARIPERLGERNTLLVFLGDYIDRGPAQIEVLALVTLLKAMHSGRVILMRGNHEPPPGLNPYPHDFPSRLLSLYGGEGRGIYRRFYEDFQLMPYATVVPGRLLMMHGGLPTYNYMEAGTLEEYLEAGREPSPRLLEEILWNDPDDTVDEWMPSPRGAGRLFGPKVTERVCRVFGCSLVVRGHQSCMEGYRYNHGGRVLTLFSRLGPPYFNSKAAYAVFRVLEDRFETMIRTVSRWD